jgi:hypothetical protein
MRPSEAKETSGIHGVNICRTRREKVGVIVKGGSFWIFSFYGDIQHCFICRSSDSTVSEDAEIAPRTVATIQHWLSDALTARLDLIHIFFFFSLLYSTLFHLSPLRFHCVGGCWHRTQNSYDYTALTVRCFNHSARSHCCPQKNCYFLTEIRTWIYFLPR